MITVLKVQLPLDNNPFALAYNNPKCSEDFTKLISLEEKELISELMGENTSVSYCKCEIENGKIVKVLEYVTRQDFMEDR